ncbi:nitrate- and nitrite sensing domain-containing protein [Micromonospora sp. PLK6-60]|nr:nitrate- and nitrite sensing domain-containing protein [Micromonospora sp. PLK6-60]MBY8873350.1 nitrate- and nitrite sensing domain-containing protein [Micromonospora sp. PLK6-60]
MNTRDWPIRAKLTALVVVPVTALLALWIFATSLAFGPALDLLSARTLLYDLGRPGETVVAELQRERRLSVVQLARGTALPALAEQRARTDTAVAELGRRIGGDRLRDAAGDLLDARLDRLTVELAALPAGREFIDGRTVDRAGAIGLYSGMIDAAFQAFAGMASLPDADLNRQALAVTALGRSRELLGRADALLAGAVTAGRFADGEHEQLVRVIDNQRFLVETALVDLPAEDRAAYQRLTESAEFVRLRVMQDALLGARPAARPQLDMGAWQTSYDAVQQRLRDFELAEADGLADRSVPVAIGILVRLAVAGLVGLAAVVASVLVAVRVGRTLARRLTAVRTAALDMADQRLPDVVARLRRGEQVDVDREAPPLDHGADEIGQVGRAFNQVRRTAVRAAVDEVTLRRGLNEVFLNLARRSQGLVHRQLALLDRMERHTEDPDELAALFQVDHLAARLRRHAEDLVILAGAAPGRGWREPVAMVDVLRGAISEVEYYDRVDITAVEPAGAVGRAVGDVIHLLAELIENGVAYSPPATRVSVAGAAEADGYVVRVTDQGLGMPARALAEANQRLARPPEFDPADSARLGLFVVARLAARHGIEVRLHAAASGGVTAEARIPAELITAEPPTPAVPATGVRPARTGRTATVPRARTGGVSRTRPAPARASLVEPADEPDGLPRRVRRRGPAAPVRSVGEAAARSPEEARRAMAALQAGTARGRRDGARPGGPAGAARTPHPAPPTGAPAPARSRPEPTAGSGPETPAESGPETPAESGPETPAGSRPEPPAGSRPEPTAGSGPEIPGGSRPEPTAGSGAEPPPGSGAETPAGSRPEPTAGSGAPAGDTDRTGGGQPAPAPAAPPPAAAGEPRTATERDNRT